VGGAVPPDEELVLARSHATGSDADSVYVLQRIAIVGRTELPLRRSGHDSNTGNGRFTLR